MKTSKRLFFFFFFLAFDQRCYREMSRAASSSNWVCGLRQSTDQFPPDEVAHATLLFSHRVRDKGPGLSRVFPWRKSTKQRKEDEGQVGVMSSSIYIKIDTYFYFKKRNLSRIFPTTSTTMTTGGKKEKLGVVTGLFAITVGFGGLVTAHSLYPTYTDRRF